MVVPPSTSQEPNAAGGDAEGSAGGGGKVRKTRNRQNGNVLELWLQMNGNNLYPNREMKERLASDMQMSYTQVNRWFANRRRKEQGVRRTPSACSKSESPSNVYTDESSSTVGLQSAAIVPTQHNSPTTTSDDGSADFWTKASQIIEETGPLINQQAGRLLDSNNNSEATSRPQQQQPNKNNSSRLHTEPTGCRGPADKMMLPLAGRVALPLDHHHHHQQQQQQQQQQPLSQLQNKHKLVATPPALVPPASSSNFAAYPPAYSGFLDPSAAAAAVLFAEQQSLYALYQQQLQTMLMQQHQQQVAAAASHCGLQLAAPFAAVEQSSAFSQHLQRVQPTWLIQRPPADEPRTTAAPPAKTQLALLDVDNLTEKESIAVSVLAELSTWH